MKLASKFKMLILSLAIMTFLVIEPTSNVYASAMTYPDAKSAVEFYAPGGTGGNPGNTFPGSLGGYIMTSAPAGSSTVNSATVGGVTYYWDANMEANIVAEANRLAKVGAAKEKDKQAVENFSNVTDGFNIAADVQTAGHTLSGFAGVVRAFLGLIVIIASLGMTVFTGLDILYIVFPVWRAKCEESKEKNGGKLKFVTDDAQYAVTAAETVQSGKNPLIIYLSKRVISMIVLGILLFILLTGRITVFTDIALRLVSGILDVIQSI